VDAEGGLTEKQSNPTAGDSACTHRVRKGRKSYNYGL
jgi:hypothetical protein